MNIEEYRAMKAEEAQSAQEQQQMDSKGEQPNAQAQQQSATISQQGSETQAQNQDEAPNATEQEQGESSQGTPQTIEIDGQEVSIDELKSGYLRQSDYTRKTQELARDREKAEIAERYYDAVQNNPELARELAEQHNLPYVSKEDARVQELEQKYYDLLVQQEVSDLQNKYGDFDVQGLIKYAFDKKMPNLEDAYTLFTASQGQANVKADDFDKDAFAEQIRQQVLAELQSNGDTASIIGTGGASAQVESQTPTLSPDEMRVARGMKLTPEEYAKWAKVK